LFSSSLILGLSILAGDPSVFFPGQGATCASSPAETKGGEAHGVKSECLANTICKLKERIRYGKDPWSPELCATIAKGMIESGEKYDLHPALILAVAIAESDLDDKASRTTHKNGAVFARDGGLMGLRCLINDKGLCTNSLVRGMHWKDLLNPLTNIATGSQMLAHYRDGGAIEPDTFHAHSTRKSARKVHFRQCRHRTHAYWAHYNHGPLYKPTGYARHYPHRVAVLYHALVRALNAALPEELAGTHLTVADPGKRARTADRPVEERYKHLTEHIAEAGSCRPIAMQP
jgi:Transglycosylase SLT domain